MRKIISFNAIYRLTFRKQGQRENGPINTEKKFWYVVSDKTKANTLIDGRVTYQMMEKWPYRKQDKPTATKHYMNIRSV